MIFQSGLEDSSFPRPLYNALAFDYISYVTVQVPAPIYSNP